VILELLRRYTVRGGNGKIFEYGGPGVQSLVAAQRMTIANMGAELTLTTSVFPSDEITRSFLNVTSVELNVERPGPSHRATTTWFPSTVLF